MLAPSAVALEFQICDWLCEDVVAHEDDVDFTDDEGVGDDGPGDGASDRLPPGFNIKVFGRTAAGRSVSLDITGFTPYMYLKVPDDAAGARFGRFSRDKLKEELHEACSVPRDCIVEVYPMYRKRFMGFENGKLHQFLRIRFTTLASMRRVARHASMHMIRLSIPGRQFQRRRFEVHESNIEPHIRFLHHSRVLPSGWVRVAAGAWTPGSEVVPSTCDIRGQVNWLQVKPLDVGARVAPLRVASFDLECYSASGEFPVSNPYRRLARDFCKYVAAQDASRPRAARLPDAADALVAAFGDGAGGGSRDPPPGVHRVVLEDQDEDYEDRCNRMTVIANKLRGGIAPNLFDLASGAKAPPAIKWGIDTRDAETRVFDAVQARLENARDTGFLPRLRGDPIIQIGTTVHRVGDPAGVTQRYVAVLGTCDPIEGVEVDECTSELEVITRWCAAIRRMDPDVMTGYNICGFDFDYLHERAKALGAWDDVRTLGRTPLRPGEFVSRALTTGDVRFIHMPGRLTMDLMKLVQRDHRLDTYKLDHVARHFTGEAKRDVPPAEIFRLHRGGASDRAVVADYCVQV